MCPNQVFFDALSNGNIPKWKWRPSKIVTLFPRPYRGGFGALPSPDSNKNIENGMRMKKNLVWSRLCASRGTWIIELYLRGGGLPAQKVHVWLGRQFLKKMCPSQVLFDALSNGNIPKWKWRPSKIVTLFPRPYRGEFGALPSPDSNKNIENGISMQKNLVWSRFCASRWTRIIELYLRGGRVAPPKKCTFG